MASDARAGSRLRPHPAIYVVSAGCYAMLLLPLVAIIFYSVLAPGELGEWAEWSFTSDWYTALLRDDDMLQALSVSLQVATLTSIGATIMGVAGALALHREKSRGSRFIAVVASLPLALPELVLGLASLLWFGVIGLSLGLSTVIIGHVTFTVAYVLTVINARLADYDTSLVDAAADLGAKPFQVISHVTLPLLTPAIGAGAIMSFTLSFDDFMMSFFTTGVDNDTLPMRIYSMIRFGINREIYALSSILILLTVAGLVLSSRLRRRTT